jgi:hypothetical protein
MNDVTRAAWTTPALKTLSISLDTSAETGSNTDGNATGNLVL